MVATNLPLSWPFLLTSHPWKLLAVMSFQHLLKQYPFIGKPMKDRNVRGGTAVGQHEIKEPQGHGALRGWGADVGGCGENERRTIENFIENPDM